MGWKLGDAHSSLDSHPRDMPTIEVATKGGDALTIAPSRKRGGGGGERSGLLLGILRAFPPLVGFLGLMGEREMHVKPKFALLGKYGTMVWRS